MKPSISNRAWGRAVVDGLIQIGASRFFMSPGARCSPLVAALADSGIEPVVHYDERGMAFAALGWASVTGQPAVCITTSGSAVANLLPACVEAFHSGIPLIFLTADRPPELRGTGANQTIEQPGIFGSFVRMDKDLPLPDDSGSIEELWESLRCIGRVLKSDTIGPVHLNVPFREPLLSAPSSPGISVPELAGGDIATGEEFAIPASFFESSRGVVVLGRLPALEQSEAFAAQELASRLGWPLIADALSGAQFLPGVIRHADWTLQRANVPKPERVLHFGGSLVSKRLGEWLAGCKGAHCLQVRRFPERLDPWDQKPVFIHSGIVRFCESMERRVPAKPSGSWLEFWKEADVGVSKILSDITENDKSLSEPAIARAVAKAAVAGALPVFLGNSMPVRDFNSCVDSVSHSRIPVFGNRGASGIDGNIATIAGVSMALGRPLLAILGDLSVLHDMNSLALLRGLPVTLVVVNNDGGGIFRFLPLGLDDALRERLWETPHGMDFSHAAAQFGIDYHIVAKTSELDGILSATNQWPRILECRTSRSGNLALHKEIADKVCRLAIASLP
jgi:2-succinyl-5-enolpyruvyl-6-hydroxy-3-cyclohexene-1-carboxylate synthase